MSAAPAGEAASASHYARWLARGREHQQALRPLDAIQCFRRAAREWPQGVEARFHLGESLWQLGRLGEAIEAWRAALHADPGFLPAWQALAEATLGTGDATAAAVAAQGVLERAPGNARAAAVHAIAGYSNPGDAPSATRTPALIAALAHAPEWLGVPALGGALAVALEHHPDAQLQEALAEAARAMVPSALHPRLHALLCEIETDAARREAWCAAMAERPLGLDDHDALRHAARAAQRAALPSARMLASLYAARCQAAFAPGVPLLAPLRSAGRRARLVVLAAEGDAHAQDIARRFAATADIVVASVAGAETSIPTAGAGRVATVALAPTPTLDDAKRLATLDADVLVDLAGLDAPVGPLLAMRPARRIVTPQDFGAALPGPLVDQPFEGDAALAAALAQSVAGPASAADRQTQESAWRAAVAAHRGGARAAAADGYAQVLAWQPGHPAATYLAAALAREAGDLDAARAGFAAALARTPGHHDARIAALSMAEVERDARRVSELTAEVPGDAPVELLRACGLAWLRIGAPGPAEQFFAAALLQAPFDGETHYNLGVALQSQRRFEDAARAYQRALACNPALTGADFNLGVIFTELGNRDGAIAAFREVVARSPAHVAAHVNLCEALLFAGRIDEWLAAFRRFEAACPDALPLAAQGIEASHYAGDFAALERILEGLRQERYVARGPVELADALEQLLYLLLYVDVEPQMLRRFGATYATAAEQVYGPALPARVERAPGRLRIGYLSADLRNHVMGKMMYQALQHHDRARFDVRLYSLSSTHDDWTGRFMAIADGFVSLAALDDASAVARIAADDLDLLVDLNTHTRGARPALLAAKPSRVQITHVASAGTLGMRTIDFKLTDHFADVPESQADQLEPLLPMDGCVYPYRRIELPATHPYSRLRLGIPADAFVIGAFVNPLKLSRRTLILWREVLERVPRALVACSPLDARLRDVYRRVAHAGGIDPARLVFVPAGRDEGENQARYEVIDVVLDPMPFGGVNGTLEALDRGVPVVTLAGRRHGERTSYSILANLGVTDTVAHTGREYVALAVRLAEDPPFAASVRSAIARGLARSPLTDMPAHTRNLEAAYLEALRRAAPAALAAAGA